MDGVGIIGAIIIGIIAGWIAEKVMNRNHGLLTNLVVGLVGGLIGSFLFGLIGIGIEGWIGSLIGATVGRLVGSGLSRSAAGRRWAVLRPQEASP